MKRGLQETIRLDLKSGQDNRTPANAVVSTRPLKSVFYVLLLCAHTKETMQETTFWYLVWVGILSFFKNEHFTASF